MESLLELQNPWWKTGILEKRLFDRVMMPDLIAGLSGKKILALVGSRQVGKTSLLYLLIQHLLAQGTAASNILYFNLDDIGLRQFFSSPEDFLKILKNGSQSKYIFIDEAQRLENPGLFLKTLFDLDLNIRLIVSGSSQLELRAKLKEFLVGR